MNRPLAIALLCIFACTNTKPPPPNPLLLGTPRAGVYSEVTDYASIEPALTNLAANHLDLFQVMPSSDIGSPALAALIRAAGKAQVGVRAWLVLPKDQGYWLNEADIDQYALQLTKLLAWIRTENLPVTAITFDIEPGWDYTQQFIALASNTGRPTRVNDLVALMKHHVDHAAFLVSQQRFEALIDQVHAAGLAAHCVTYPMVLDDYQNRDSILQDALDIPVAGLDWDETSFMIYRSTFQLLAEQSLSNDLIYSYAVDAVAHFGANAGADFGVIGDDPVSGAKGYETPAELSADISAAVAAGISPTRLHLYSYEEAALLPPLAPWLAFPAAPDIPAPATDPNVSALRSEFALLSVLLRE